MKRRNEEARWRCEMERRDGEARWRGEWRGPDIASKLYPVTVMSSPICAINGLTFTIIGPIIK
jgi:hypothetical protein